MDVLPVWVPLIFFLIALLYSTMGFGGGSSYLAVLVLVGLPYAAVPSLALACNLVVTTGGVWLFFKGGHLRLAKVLPFVMLSIPMAYVGGRITIEREVFCLILGFSLCAAALRIFMPDTAFACSRAVSRKEAWAVGVPLGALLGLLAGLVGIGGGIFLSPLLLLMRWVTVKEAAACASLFIVVNSVAGLFGQFQKGMADFSLLMPLAVAVLLGGQIGSRLGSFRLPSHGMERLLACLILYVGVRLVLEGL